MDESPAIVVDVGSGFMKAGLSDQAEPPFVWPSLVGRPRRRYQSMYPGNPFFAGEEAIDARHQLTFMYPIDHGHIDNWSLMDELWSHIFQPQHGLDPEVRPVLITQPPMASDLHQQRIVEVMFEIYRVPELHLGTQGILSLHATGRTTGCVVEVGDGVTQIVPLAEGNLQKESVIRVDCGGQELTMYLRKLLCNNGSPFTTRDDLEYCRVMKETYCYCALDPTTEDLRNDLDITYTFPDGVQLRDGSKEVTLGPERFHCAEPLFNPALIDRDHAPLYDLIMDSIGRAPIDLRTTFLENIVLAGGTTMFAGLPERLHHDMAKIIPSSKLSNLHVIADESRTYSAWIGGRIAAATREAQRELWVTAQEYQEEGDRVIMRFRPM